MLKSHGFHVPDIEYLSDLDGLIKYLGLKISVGHVPLYVRGSDTNGKRLRSQHACQRHMIDTNNCKMVYDENEDEYEDYYDYTALEEEIAEQERQMVLHPGEEARLNPLGELVIPASSSASSSAASVQKVIGHREYARYYKQRTKLEDTRQSVLINQLVAKYRNLGIETVRTTKTKMEQKYEKRATHMASRRQYKMDLRSIKIYDLPQYVPW